MRVFGIDPGSERTGYGCIETDSRRHHLVACGAITSPAHTPFPDRLLTIHVELGRLLAECRPDCVAIENLFYATNVRSALRLGHARGVAIVAAAAAGVAIAEYTPAEIKRAVVGYGRADRPLGGLGIVGPTRMDYPGNMAAVRAVARYVGHLLAES